MVVFEEISASSSTSGGKGKGTLLGGNSIREEEKSSSRKRKAVEKKDHGAPKTHSSAEVNPPTPSAKDADSNSAPQQQKAKEDIAQISFIGYFTRLVDMLGLIMWSYILSSAIYDSNNTLQDWWFLLPSASVSSVAEAQAAKSTHLLEDALATASNPGMTKSILSRNTTFYTLILSMVISFSFLEAMVYSGAHIVESYFYRKLSKSYLCCLWSSYFAKACLCVLTYSQFIITRRNGTTAPHNEEFPSPSKVLTVGLSLQAVLTRFYGISLSLFSGLATTNAMLNFARYVNPFCILGLYAGRILEAGAFFYAAFVNSHFADAKNSVVSSLRAPSAKISSFSESPVAPNPDLPSSASSLELSMLQLVVDKKMLVVQIGLIVFLLVLEYWSAHCNEDVQALFVFGKKTFVKQSRLRSRSSSGKTWEEKRNKDRNVRGSSTSPGIPLRASKQEGKKSSEKKKSG